MIERISPPGFLRKCIRCGHRACPCCGGWCDSLLPDYESVREADRERVLKGEGLQTYTIDSPEGEWTTEVFQVKGDDMLCCGGECQYEEPLPEGFAAFMEEVYELGLHFMTEGDNGEIIARNELPVLKVVQ